MLEREKRLYEYSEEDQVVTSHELLEKLKSNKRLNVYFRSGIPTLDMLIDGFQGGELTTISGTTKQGKTLLAQTLTRHFAKNEIGCLWFTYEVPALQFLNQYGIDLPLFYMPAQLKGNTMQWLDDRIYEAILKRDIKAVFIDHLHYLVDMGKHNISLEIGFVMRTLKKMALKYNICMFIIAHTGKVKEDKELDNESIRDSSFVAQESDNVFFIWRQKTNPQQAVLKIAANRRNGVMNKKISLIKVNDYLEELEYDK